MLLITDTYPRHSSSAHTALPPSIPLAHPNITLACTLFMPRCAPNPKPFLPRPVRTPTREPPKTCFPKCASSRALQSSQASEDQMPNPIQQHHTPYYYSRQLQNRNFIPRRSHAREACSGTFERRGEGGEGVGLNVFISGIARVRLGREGGVKG
jgi:hypothetical protein